MGNNTVFSIVALSTPSSHLKDDCQPNFTNPTDKSSLQKTGGWPPLPITFLSFFSPCTLHFQFDAPGIFESEFSLENVEDQGNVPLSHSAQHC